MKCLGFNLILIKFNKVSMCQELLYVCVRKTAIKLVLRAWCLYSPKQAHFLSKLLAKHNLKHRYMSHSF